MSGHVVLRVDCLATLEPFQSVQGVETSVESSCACNAEPASSSIGIDALESDGADAEEQPLIQCGECRICQEEDSINNLEVPCSCSGSLKFAHRTCVQRWCNEKGDITCEICHQSYQPNYSAPPRSNPDDTTIDISGSWMISGTPMDLHDPRLLAMAAAERHFLEAEYEEYSDSNASGAAFCRSAALILMALLLLRHAVNINTSDDSDDDETSTFFTLFLLRAAGFLLPCYIMAWAISVLQRRRQRQEAAALAASEVEFMLQAGQHRSLQFTIASGPGVSPPGAAPSPSGPASSPPSPAMPFPGPAMPPHQESIQ